MSEAFPSTLPQDLIVTEILPRLPLKTIGRFKCVSKPWKRDLSTSRFAKAHFNFHKHDQPEDFIFSTYYPHVLLASGAAEHGSDAIYGDVNFPFEGSVDVVGSWDGLVLLLADSYLLLLNPITLKGLKLPDRPNTRFSTSASTAYGVGFDSSTDDYKIVAVSSAEKGSGRFADIFSVKMKSWKRVGFSTPYVHIPAYYNGMFFNGRLHWKYVKIVSQRSLSVLIAFDLAREEFEEVCLPEGDDVEPYCFEIMVVDGCLALIDNRPHSPIVVWVMREYGVKSSWTVLTMVDISWEQDYQPQQLVYQLNEDEFVVVKNGELRVYNWRDGLWKDMVIADAPQGLVARICLARSTTSFKRSLISPC